MKKTLLILSLFFLFIVKMQAQDSTGTDDLVFTEVGSAQDSAANNIVKDTVKQDSAAQVTAAVKAQDKPAASASTEEADHEKTLWQTFIAGLVGGFLAF
jgi:hypothetical protein